MNGPQNHVDRLLFQRLNSISLKINRSLGSSYDWFNKLDVDMIDICSLLSTVNLEEAGLHKAPSLNTFLSRYHFFEQWIGIPMDTDSEKEDKSGITGVYVYGSRCKHKMAKEFRNSVVAV